MLKKKSTPPGKKGMPQKRISGRSNEAIDASLPRDIGNNLNARQTEFVKQYLVDLNATQAAIRAGYSAQTARQMGSENLSKPYIAAEIERAMAERGGITRTSIVHELGAIAFSNICDVIAWDQSVEEPPTKTGSLDGRVVPAVTSRVTVQPSATMDPAVRRAISKIVVTGSRGLGVKMHDKGGRAGQAGARAGNVSGQNRRCIKHPADCPSTRLHRRS